MVNFMDIPRELREQIFFNYLHTAVADRRASNSSNSSPPLGPSATRNEQLRNARHFLMDQFRVSHFEQYPCLEVSIGGRHKSFLAKDLAAAIIPILLLNKQTHGEAMYMLATRFCFRLDEGTMTTHMRFLEKASPKLLTQIRCISIATCHPCPCPNCGRVPEEKDRPWTDDAHRRCLTHLRAKLPGLRQVYIPKMPDWTDENGRSVALEHWPTQLLAFHDLLKHVKIVPSDPEVSSSKFDELNRLLKERVVELQDDTSWAAVEARPWRDCGDHVQNATNFVRVVKREL